MYADLHEKHILENNIKHKYCKNYLIISQKTSWQEVFSHILTEVSQMVWC